MKHRILLVLVLVGLLTGCTSSNPGTAVEQYYQRLVAKDQSKFVSGVCAKWEKDALLEFDSFGTVQVGLKDVSCQQTGEQHGAAIVKCKGSLEVTYQAENTRQFSLEENTYQVVQESGEWRVCGYE